MLKFEAWEENTARLASLYHDGPVLVESPAGVKCIYINGERFESAKKKPSLVEWHQGLVDVLDKIVNEPDAHYHSTGDDDEKL